MIFAKKKVRVKKWVSLNQVEGLVSAIRQLRKGGKEGIERFNQNSLRFRKTKTSPNLMIRDWIDVIFIFSFFLYSEPKAISCRAFKICFCFTPFGFLSNQTRYQEIRTKNYTIPGEFNTNNRTLNLKFTKKDGNAKN